MDRDKRADQLNGKQVKLTMAGWSGSEEGRAEAQTWRQDTKEENL